MARVVQRDCKSLPHIRSLPPCHRRIGEGFQECDRVFHVRIAEAEALGMLGKVGIEGEGMNPGG